jgi:hypothetical protein
VIRYFDKLENEFLWCVQSCMTLRKLSERPAYERAKGRRGTEFPIGSAHHV